MINYNNSNLETVTVEKSRLLEQLITNRDSHKEMYEEALEGFVNDARVQLQAKMNDLEAGHTKNLCVSFSAPTNHTKEYDVAIEMLEWSKDTQITLDKQEFKCFVMDDWSWSNNWFVQNAGYSTASSGCAVVRGLL